MSREEYTPITGLKSEVSPHVDWHLHLPADSPETIGVNVRRLDRILGISGLGTVIAAGDSGKNMVLNNPYHPEDFSFGEYQRPDAKLSVDLAGIQETLVEAGTANDSVAWARQIDASLRRGARNLAYENLVGERSGRDRYSGAASLLMGAWPTVQVLEAGFPAWWPAVWVAGSDAFVQLVHSRMARTRGVNKEHKRLFSLVPGIALDRLAVVNGMSIMAPLARAIRAEQDRT